MADISTELAAIHAAKYGEEVRGSIADALEAMNEQAAAAQKWADGKDGSSDVPSTDPAYHNNAKYYSEQAATSATEAASSATSGPYALANEAPTFSATAAYAAGDYVIYSNTLYRFKAAHAAGAWTGTDAVEAKLGPDVAKTNSALNDQATMLGSKYMLFGSGGIHSS